MPLKNLPALAVGSVKPSREKISLSPNGWIDLQNWTPAELRRFTDLDKALALCMVAQSVSPPHRPPTDGYGPSNQGGTIPLGRVSTSNPAEPPVPLPEPEIPEPPSSTALFGVSRTDAETVPGRGRRKTGGMK